jgi:hypothetical protein
VARVLAVLGGDPARLVGGVTSPSATIRPSAFDTIFWHTTSTPSRERDALRAAGAVDERARSSPGAPRAARVSAS